MANRTVKDAHTVHGTNPQYLVEKIIRTRIYESKYWKEECFALTAKLLVDKAVQLKYVGGVYGGNTKPTPFLCLILKMLQIQPDKDIVIEFIKQQDYKYVRALGALYLRLIGDSVECYKYLEPLFNDYRKLKEQSNTGDFQLIYMDEFIDKLLTADRVCDIILPRIQKRGVLVEANSLEPRNSVLDEELGDIDLAQLRGLEEQEAAEVADKERESGARNRDVDEEPRRAKEGKEKSRRRARSRSRSRERDRGGRDRDRGKERDRDRERDKDRERRHRRSRDRHRSRSQDRPSRHDDRDKRETSRDRKKRHKEKKSTRKDEDEEIREANELRAKLGLQPLKL